MKRITDETTQTTAGFPAPPAHLSHRSQYLWAKLGPANARSMQRRTLFQVALECLDRADEARELIVSEGLISPATGAAKMAHLHPAVRVERDARQQFAAIWQQLKLVWNNSPDVL
jgi:hypothetical protein